MRGTQATPKRGPPSDWEQYATFDPSSPLVRWLFLDVMVRGYRDLLRRASFSHPISILELGAGTGYTSLRLTEALPTRKITLVDSSSAMLATAKRTLAHLSCETAFLHRDVRDLELDERFDLVHSAGLVEHFGAQDRMRLLRLHVELTRGGGYCVVYAPTPTPSYRFWRRLAEGLHLWLYTDEVPIPGEVLLREMKEAGLRVLGTNRFWSLFLTETGVIGQKSSPPGGRA